MAFTRRHRRIAAQATPGRRAQSVAALALMLGSASAAPAQSLPEPRFTTFSPREAGGPVAVADRPQPLYEPAGIPAGSFRIFPSVQAGLFLDSNVFQSRVSQDQDAALFLRPRVEARNDWATGELRLWADST
ncbi:MAG TPA: outer membrane beta-barrel protein, partial [Allosphingosinicella sp.]